MLDYGSGSGAAFWACHEMWGDDVEEYQLVESNEFIKQFAMDILRVFNFSTFNFPIIFYKSIFPFTLVKCLIEGERSAENQALVHQNITFRRHLIPSSAKKFDLVIAHRVLIEIASQSSRIDLLNALWHRTNRFISTVFIVNLN